MSAQTLDISKFRKTVSFQALLLGTCTLVASFLLSTGDIGTRDAIKLRAEEDLKASISQVIPAQLHDNDLLQNTLSISGANGEPITVYQGSVQGSTTALAFTVSSFGYGGKISAIMALNPQGEILGVRVLSHVETPGLGDKIEVAKDDWILGFDGLSLQTPSADKWAVKKDGGHFDQFSGATITPRAVVKAVKSGLELFAGRKAELLRQAAESNQPTAEPTQQQTGNADSEPQTSEVKQP